MIPDNIPKPSLFRKPLSSTMYMASTIVLIAVGAFGLGRLSVLQEQKGSLQIYAPGEASVGRALAQPTANAPQKNTEVPAKNFVASKNGTKYYAATCTGAARIKPDNQIWFASAVDAEAAGYTKAANCQ